MSRIGKNPIAIPEKTTVTVSDGVIAIAGPKGELRRRSAPSIEITVEGGEVTVAPKNETPEALALWGTFAAHIRNMIAGVNEPFVKKLEVEGVGYRAEVKGSDLVLNVGYSHPVALSIPDGLAVTAEKNVVTVSGIDKEAVGQFSANVRAVRKPEPYKGKGIHYEGEQIRRKQGKKAGA
ncbi:MAG TPA: 50S ribosomal protein L6 [Candidatus Paceibacterota bacterium]|nr:50S ribosomal protein L6 [Candidatus Paceibacterota bacterium]